MSNVRLVMILFLASEAIFFTFLLVAYINFHLGPAQGSMAHDLDVMKTGVNTLILVASSFTAWRAHSAFLKAQFRRFQSWLLATIILGLAFVYGQATEYL